MEQRFEPGKFKIDTTYIFTFFCKSGLYSGNIMPGTQENDKRIYLNNDLLNVAIIKNEFYDSVIIGIKEGHREYLLALKLEEGNTQSLARKTTTGWELLEEPDYSYELIKCQRYYQVYSNSINRPNSYIDCRPVIRKPINGDITQGTVEINGKTQYYNSAIL